jgi:hypothetical protein
MTAILHVIPADEPACPSSSTFEEYTSLSPSSSSSLSLQDSSSVQDASVSTSSSSRRRPIRTSEFFDLAIEDLKRARYVTSAAASAVVKREAAVVHKRLTAYRKRAHKRFVQRTNRKKRFLLPSSRTRSVFQDDMMLDSELSVIETTHPFEEERHHATRAASIASSDSSSITTTSSTNDDQQQQSATDGAVLSADEIHGQTSIMNQAHRMKLMSILLRSIEANQRLLLRELMNCKQAALEDEEFGIS